jgi:hypothetical protein
VKLSGKRLLAATSTLCLLLLSGAPALAQSISLSGTLYQYRADRDRPAPASSVRVFVREPSAGKWIGPILTDAYGRFAFYNLKAGRYLLKVYRSASTESLVWQQEVAVPGQLQPIVFR